MGEKVDWVNKLWMLSPNEQLNILGLPKNDNPSFDEPWIDGTKQPMSEVAWFRLSMVLQSIFQVHPLL